MDASIEDETGVKKYPMGRYALASITKLPDGKVQYGCKECPVKHTDKEFLEHHLFLHYNEHRFLCYICGAGLKRREHLERHTQGHLEVRPHLCPDCGKAFKRKEHLNIHRSIHSGDKSMYCTVCKKSFYRKDHLQKHLQTHNKIFSKNIKSVCDENGVMFEMKRETDEDFEQQEEIEVKQELVDVDYEEKPILPDVVQDDNSEEEIKMEIDETYEGSPVQTDSPGVSQPASPLPPKDMEPRPFACNVCGKRFKRRDHLKVHSFTHVKKENGCDECGKAFHSAELLLDHVSRVHGDDYTNDPEMHFAVQTIVDTQMNPELPYAPDNSLLVPRAIAPVAAAVEAGAAGAGAERRPHGCHVCGRRFKRRQHLKVHANVHLKLQPTIWCSLCDVGFYDNNQFEGHQCIESSHTLGTKPGDEPPQHAPKYDARKENNYPIEFIEVEENIKILDETRLQTQPSEEMSIPTPLRVYVCKYCSKPFKRKDHYRIHLNIHTGVKSFFCPHCQKGFYRKDHMKKHALIHDKPKPQFKNKTKKQIPDLYPINKVPKVHAIKPEITIHAPSNSALRVPLSIKVPYKMVMSLDNGEQRAVTVDPHAHTHAHAHAPKSRRRRTANIGRLTRDAKRERLLRAKETSEEREARLRRARDKYRAQRALETAAQSD